MSTIVTASRQYASRPADERFPSLQAMIADALHEKNLSGERTYNLRDLRAVSADGGIMLASPKGQAPMTHWAFGQLARTIGAPAGYLRDGLSPELAASCITHGLHSAPVGTTANLLIRGANGQPPIIRACTSESYGRVWDAELYSAIDQQIVQPGSNVTGRSWGLPPTWTGEPAGAYRGDRDSFLILTDGGSIVSDPSLRASGAGTSADQSAMFRGLLVRNSETGASSITIETILYRYVCGNHMLWGAVIDKRFRRRHVGKSALRETMREIGRIAFQWASHSAQQDQAIIRGLIDHELASTRDAVIDELRAMGATAEQAASAYDTCERSESASPRSFWGLAQGLTRDSQTTPYQDERYALDRLAGVVLARGAKLVAA